jgi:hypothetical protein
MSKFSPIDTFNPLEALERKVIASAGVVAGPMTTPNPTTAAADDEPLPPPDPNPIPDPGDGPPIDYPLLPPVGPAGPGS